MVFDVKSFSVFYENEVELYATQLFCNEAEKRTGIKPIIASTAFDASIVFKTDSQILHKDTFIIEKTNSGYLIKAKTIRGLIFGYSLFLRKAKFSDNRINIISDIFGLHSPQKKIRGHQIGYRTTPNTYDAWDYDQYFRCQLDMMAFGSNTIEHNGSRGKGEFKNCLMKYEQEEFLNEASALADKVDMDVSVWHANEDFESFQDAVNRREKLYSGFARLNYFFPPGSDPGNLPAEEFILRCKAFSHSLKKLHPDLKIQPSAQVPHNDISWGETFFKLLNEEPDEIDAVIMGPNHACPIHQMREKTPKKYPLRFYPDITHNLRCEYPVNYREDDWHFAFANTLSRESVNPRPTELCTLHRLHSPYTIGSVSYSEGVHDDVNKAVWSALEWNKNASLREILEDYGRFFIHEANEEEIADIIFLLERNWQGDPIENPCIDIAYSKLCNLKNSIPALSENWRFMLLYFRGCCDFLVKSRRIFEQRLIKNAISVLKTGDINNALCILSAPYSDSYNTLRGELNSTAQKLFELIGIQLDVEHYHTDNWERGATLDTIDNNITDRAFLKEKLTYILSLPEKEQKHAVNTLLNRNETDGEEVYFSVALHNLSALGIKQDGEFYMDIRGDRPEYKANPLPMSLAKVYDHFSFKAHFGGFEPGCDYRLIITYQQDINTEIQHHKIIANNFVIYDGPQFGGEKNEKFDKITLQKGFETASYILKSDVLLNGTLNLEISEPTEGVKLCELWIKKI